jgi:hypothetical protein
MEGKSDRWEGEEPPARTKDGRDDYREVKDSESQEIEKRKGAEVSEKGGLQSQ